MRAVFLDQQTFSQDIDFSLLIAQTKEFTGYDNTQPEQVVERCKKADIVITNKVVLNAAILKQLPDLKLICVAATGTNNIDITAAKALGIAVTNVADYAGSSVAQYILAQLLHYFQNIHAHNQNTRDGNWSKSETFCMHGSPIEELAGKTLGLIGYGHIAESLAKIAKAFGMSVIIGERKGATRIRQNRISFEHLLRDSDIISLHCPLTEDTEKLINNDTLALMKPTALLVNTARGPIVCSEALRAALIKGTIAYAIIDVLETEPPPACHPLLIDMPENIAVTAHMAWASKQAQTRLLATLAKNIQSFEKGHKLNRLV